MFIWNVINQFHPLIYLNFSGPEHLQLIPLQSGPVPVLTTPEVAAGLILAANLGRDREKATECHHTDDPNQQNRRKGGIGERTDTIPPVIDVSLVVVLHESPFPTSIHYVHVRQQQHIPILTTHRSFLSFEPT